MVDALVLCLLKGFYCHSSRSFAPRWSFQFELNQWIIRLFFIETSLNPNEDVLMQFLKTKLNHQFINKDIVFTAYINTDNTDHHPIIEVSNVEEFEFLKANKKIVESLHFQAYFKNNCHFLVNEIYNNEPIVFSNDGNVYVAKSLIANAGLGLFANKNFHRNDTLLTFKGKKIKFNEFCKKYPESLVCKHHEYALTAETFDGIKYVFDPIENETFDLYTNAIKNQNFGPLINEPSEFQISNCETVSYHNQNIPLRVDIVVTRFIAKNEEILLLYNRDAEFYKPGSAPQPPLLLPSSILSSQKQPIKLYCFNMNWNNNSDYYRLAQWQLQFESVFVISLGDNEKPDNNFTLKTMEDVVVNLHKTKRKNILFANNTINTNIWDIFQLGFDELILSFHTHSIYNFFYLNETFPNQLGFELKLLKKNNEHFMHDSSETSNLDSLFPFIRYQPSAKRQTFFLRFRDVWTEKRIIEDESVSDEKTVEWLSFYRSKNKIDDDKNVKIPSFKIKTQEFLRIGNAQ